MSLKPNLAIRALSFRASAPVILALCICLQALPAAAVDYDPQRQPARADRTEILWDEFGVPHIYGKDVPDVLRGYGYAQMENHAELLLQRVAFARGRSAEYFGAGQSNQNVTNDINVRINAIPQRAARWYNQGGAEQRSFLVSFVSGINQYAETHRDTIAPQFLQVLPITPADILAAYQHTIHYSAATGQSNVSSLVRAWQSDTLSAGEDPARILENTGSGSNGWALAPSRTKRGNAILMGNPHLPWGMNQPLTNAGSVQWFEAHLVTDTLNAHGATFVGLPFISIGFNDDLGWTHTANTMKNADLYELTLVNDGYLWEGRVLPLSHRAEQVRIRQSDGTLQTQNLDVLSSVHGPIVAQKGNKALALRVAGLDAPSVVSQYWGMIRARNLREFKEANRALQLPVFNLLYADRHGDIMFLFGGRQPVRDGGGYSDWLGILPGDRASTLWMRTLSWSELPKTINPVGGFVQNCNDPPWTSAFPQTIFPERYPAYLAPQIMGMRPQHSARFLLSKPSFTFDDVLAGKMSTHMELASRLLPDLIAAAKASGNPTALAAADVLQAWDGASDAASRGAALFELWYLVYVSDPGTPKSETYNAENGTYPPFRIDWSPEQPLTTPQGMADPASAVPALVVAANLLQQSFGAINVPWGDVHRTMLVTWDAGLTTPIPLSNSPVSGSPSIFGAIRVVESVPIEGFRQFAAGGDGYVQIVEFADEGPRAETLLTYGNASRPGSAHISDQLPLFDQKRLRPTPRTRAEVEAQAVQRERL